MRSLLLRWAPVALLGCAPPAAPAPAAAPSLHEVVEAAVERGFAGSVIVAEGHDLLLKGGYGTAGGEPVALDDRFWIASAGKQFVAAALLRLADRGALSLDDEVGLHLTDAPPGIAGATLVQLLTHTSGIAQSYVSEEQPSREAALRAMYAEAPEGPPGEAFRYANSNYQLAAAVVEVVAGQPYREVLRSEFLAPLGLADTGLASEDSWATVRPIEGELPDRLRRAYWGEQGAFASAPDLFRWTRAVWTGGVLGPASTERLFAPAVPLRTVHSALGWFIGTTERGSRYVFTRGNESFGANALVYVYPEREVTVVILTHAGNADEETSWSRALLADLEEALEL